MPCRTLPITLLVLLPSLLLAPPPRSATGADVEYQRDVRPILHRCHACHGALRQQGGLRLDTADLARQGGDSGPAIVPGDAAESLLLQAVLGDGAVSFMPPEGEAPPLTPAEIDTLRVWIEQGAVAPEDEPIPPDPRQHWAFQAPRRPVVPEWPDSEAAAWIRTPVDAFIRARHHELGLSPSAPAPKHVLIRRIYLDLVGLPPSPEAVEAFLSDESPDAYERVVQRLLDSPQYGERWGRHWMDVWRYGDWAGYRDEIRESQYHLWRWRDWIVEGLNADRPYHQMIQEMLAGDELAPTDPDVLRATGYLGRSWYKFNRNVWLDNVVEHAGKAFLGLTFNCARCHDHKYDPLTQVEYYQLRAIFESHDVRYDPVAGQPDVNKDGIARVFDKRPDEPTYLFVRGNEAQPDKDRPLAPELPSLFGVALRPEPVALPVEGYYPALSGALAQQARETRQQAVDAARAKWEEARAALAGSEIADEDGGSESRTADGGSESRTADGGSESRGTVSARESRPTEMPLDEVATPVNIAAKVWQIAEAELTSYEARLGAERAKYGLDPGDGLEALSREASQAERRAAAVKAELAVLEARQQLDTARQAATENNEKAEASQAKVMEAEKQLADAIRQVEEARSRLAEPSEQYAPVGEIHPRHSTGRRLALARWIASRENPLTARVAVNQIWMRHFGEPLVATVFDLGVNGKAPTHPELLDWLAVELMENGWRMKPIHRLIVLSSTYQQDSRPPDSLTDPDPRAIDPDNLSLWRMNSRRMEAEVVRDSLLQVGGSLDLTMGGREIDENQGETVPRRSIYFRHGKEKEMVFTKVFDGPGVSECYQRGTSIVPQQSLALANSPLAKTQARLLADRLTAEPAATVSSAPSTATESDSEDTFIDRAFWHVLGRSAESEEHVLCRQFLAEQTRLLADPTALTPASVGQASRVAPSESPRQRARENLVHVLLNHHDFVTIH
jgi:hypothetical protein